MKFSAVLGFAALAAATPQWGCKPGTYSCTPNHKGWRTCNTSRQWVYSGSCGSGQYCAYNAASKSPYCYPYGTHQ